MTVATMEDLAAMPEGATIRTTDSRHGVEWTKQGDGWSNGQVTLRDELFANSVKNSRVLNAAMMAPEPGQLWFNNQYDRLRYNYVILEVIEDGAAFKVATMRRGNFHNIDRLEQRHLVHNGGPVERWAVTADWPMPEWVDNTTRMGALLLRQEAEQDRINRLRQEELQLREAAQRELNELRASTQPVVTDELIEELTTYSRILDSDDELFTVLSNHGVVLQREHTSQVKVYGTYEYDIDYDVAREHLPHVDIDEVRSAEIDWYTHVDVTLTGNGCTCSDVDRDAIEAVLPDSVRHASWDFEEVECN